MIFIYPAHRLNAPLVPVGREPLLRRFERVEYTAAGTQIEGDRMKTLATLTLMCFVLVCDLGAQTCSNSSLSGTYFYILAGDIASAGTTLAYAELGKLIADGQGNVTGQSTASIGGSLSPYSLSGNYTVQGDCTGTLALSVNSQPPSNITFEIVDGGASAVVAFSSPGAVTVGRAYRTASQCGNGSLTGGYGYLFSGITNTSSGTFLYSDAGRVLADGNGGLTVKSNANLGAGATQVTGTGSYAINSDCSGTAQVTDTFGTAHYVSHWSVVEIFCSLRVIGNGCIRHGSASTVPVSPPAICVRQRLVYGTLFLEQQQRTSIVHADFQE